MEPLAAATSHRRQAAPAATFVRVSDSITVTSATGDVSITKS